MVYFCDEQLKTRILPFVTDSCRISLKFGGVVMCIYLCTVILSHILAEYP